MLQSLDTTQNQIATLKALKSATPRSQEAKERQQELRLSIAESLENQRKSLKNMLAKFGKFSDKNTLIWESLITEIETLI